MGSPGWEFIFMRSRGWEFILIRGPAVESYRAPFGSSCSWEALVGSSYS